MAAVKGSGMPWQFADALHFDEAKARMCPLVNATVDIPLYHSTLTKELEVQSVVLPDRRSM
jgi:hypothetical protein